MSASNGGSAFPRAAQKFVDPYDPSLVNKIAEEALGMSLRDWFAGHLIDGAARDLIEPDHLAERAYAIADAMLKARTSGTD